MERYCLNVQHRGAETGDFCVYQTLDDQAEDIRSLVWFSKRAHPDTDLRFQWYIDYGFAWSEQGSLAPGVVFEASQIMDADPSDPDRNSIAFSKRGSMFMFEKTDKTTPLGRLGIFCDSLIPTREGSIGISMSGKSAFACPASPNMKYTFRPHPRYWIAFGKFDEGEVIDLNRMTRKFEIRFRENQYNKSICFTGNTWADQSE